MRVCETLIFHVCFMQQKRVIRDKMWRTVDSENITPLHPVYLFKAVNQHHHPALFPGNMPYS